MDTGRRAKIFAPFDALKWFDERITAKETIYTDRRILSQNEREILDERIRGLESLTRKGNAARKNRPVVTAAYFEPCTDPENDAYMVRGTYRELTGILQKVDPVVFCTITISGKDIPLPERSAIPLPPLPDPADQIPVYTTADPWQENV